MNNIPPDRPLNHCPRSSRLAVLLSRVLCVLLSSYPGLTASLHAQTARWADPSLPVTAGLELWLDATRENEAREAHYMNRLANGDHAEIWHDSSGHERHVVQWTESARPVWNSGALEFDGNDYLAALLTPSVSLENSTIFIVTAVPTPGGDFPALLSAARRGENDFTSGICVDFGRKASPKELINYLNVEGAGQLQEANTLTSSLPARYGHLFSISVGPDETTVRVDGQAQGRRNRAQVAFAIDRFAVGARFVSPEMRHFLKGTLAEVLIFGRKLNEQELVGVETFLGKKHGAFLTQPLRRATVLPREEVPIVQMLVPGFEVYELPIKTTNLNNIEYAPDGRLFAGGYDGRFHLLRDHDQDGLEEEIITFEARTSDDYPLGMVVKDGMPHALLSDEIIRFRDTDGDGVPDKRETVIKGWDDPELRNSPLLMHRRVDSAMAIAAGPDDDWYVTMGSANPGNAYWQKAEGDPFAIGASKTGKPAYSPEKRRGCLLRIGRNGKVEQLTSGLRYIMSLQWDRNGELFGTDQEGATWLPNGNPYDELLHLEKGRHYGFPPRHPVLLPNVVDEPSVWDYAPQHQSTCGFRFNGPSGDRPRFGPEFWAYDAIVTGESRGKLWRTKLVKSSAGYVATNQLFACIGMLVTDCAISPKGELVICCHSGPPDWGSGPANTGRLFKIRYVNADLPQPVGAWAKSATQTIVEFDRPLSKSNWSEPGKVTMEGGAFVSAGDRFELIRPGYAVVRDQQQSPRFEVPVESTQLGEDGRSLIIKTAPRRQDLSYAIGIAADRKARGIKQSDAIDLAFRLTGLEAKWEGAGQKWEGCLPHLDLSVARELSQSNGSCQTGLRHIATLGKLTLSTQLDLSNMLRPKTQPGSKLDYEPEPEVVTITLKCESPLSVKGPGVMEQGRVVSFKRTVDSVRPWQELQIEVTTPVKQIEVTYHTAIDGRERPLGVNRFLLPFALRNSVSIGRQLPAQITGGNLANGKAIFFGKAACFSCHRIGGEGHAVGPDLSNSAHRDYESLLRDIVDPNATINPDAVAYMVTLADGTQVIGTRVGEAPDELKLAAPGGTITALKKSEIKSSEAMPRSLMPTGLLDSLTAQEVKDLMTFLMTPADDREK